MNVKKKDIHVPGGLRTPSPSGRAAEHNKELGVCGQSVPFKKIRLPITYSI